MRGELCTAPFASTPPHRHAAALTRSCRMVCERARVAQMTFGAHVSRVHFLCWHVRTTADERSSLHICMRGVPSSTVPGRATGVVDAIDQQYAPVVTLGDQAKDDDAAHDQHGHTRAPPTRTCTLPEAQRAQAKAREVAARPRDVAVAIPLYAPPRSLPARPQASQVRCVGFHHACFFEGKVHKTGDVMITGHIIQKKRFAQRSPKKRNFFSQGPQKRMKRALRLVLLVGLLAACCPVWADPAHGCVSLLCVLRVRSTRAPPLARPSRATFQARK